MDDEIHLLEREEPLSRLTAALEAARRGRGRVVSIEGEAGIGKTSLVLSFAEAHRHEARVHVGGCEHLTTPEPLGPLRDIARESQGRFAVRDSSQLGTFEALLRLLVSGRGPAILIIEDLHWADDPTLDLMRYLGRRIREAPILVVVTFRSDEPASQERLAALWADMPRDFRERVELRLLSLAAVSLLARAVGRAPREVFDATGGNPFHVTEYLATADTGVPRSVQEATLARAAALSAHGRRTLDCAAIFPRQIDEETLRILAADADHAGVEECLRSGMLNARGASLSFRHELARRAIHDAMSPLRRRELHATALAVLKARTDGRAAEAAHHAEQAGALQDLVAFSVQAAGEAAALGAYREAVAHLAKALAHGIWRTDAERAGLLERQAEFGEGCGAFDAAVAAIEEAIVLHRRASDALGLGNALRISARLCWQNGQADLGERRAQEAIDLMGSHADTWQYAMALSAQSQLDMVAGHHDQAIARGLEAMDRAEQLGRTDIYLHARTNVAAARCYTDLGGGLPYLEETIEEARARDAPDALPRLFTCLTYMLAHDRRYDGLFEALHSGIDAAEARENAPLDGYMRGVRATALLDLGRIGEAVAEAEGVVFGPYPRGITRFPALVALSRARVRLGTPEGGVLDEARALPPDRSDIMRLVPLAVADAEAHWLGEARPRARQTLRAAYETVLRDWSQLWTLGDTTLWLSVLQEPVEFPGKVLDCLWPAHRLHVTGRWREAAEAWREMGCPYEQAIALSMGDEAAQRAALALFDRLGAAPAARRLRRVMRRGGVRSVPSGPRTARRNDPAGLTPRQNEVLVLLAAGLSNAEIGARLNTSAKTVEHHVSAILAAFEATSRLSAVQIARERGLFQPAET